ncbi:MAG TPA: MmcQ/YjbR family DNA-binding protein [Streptosporangiaceae bacterium]
MDDTNASLAERLRAICLALPQVTERLSHGAPTWFVRDKKSFVTLWADGHHDNQFPHLWCAAPPGAQAELTAAAPERFFRPPYVGGRGWIGVRLGPGTDWAEIAELCQDAYRVIAPARLAAQLDG